MFWFFCFVDEQTWLTLLGFCLVFDGFMSIVLDLFNDVFKFISASYSHSDSTSVIRIHLGGRLIGPHN